MPESNLIKEQMELLKNNIAVFDILENYITEQKLEIQDLKDVLERLEEKNIYLERSLQVLKDGFEDIYNQLNNNAN